MAKGKKVCTAILASWFACGAWAASAQTKPASPPPAEKNWTGNYPECGHKAEFLKGRDEPMSLGVLIAVKDPVVAEQFRNAMNFWSRLIDMEWHEVTDPKDCAIAVVPGTREILSPTPDQALAARSQNPGWPDFKGLIAWDMQGTTNPHDIYITAVHEIGHTLRLDHNKNYKSLMYRSDVEGIFVMKLDKTDLTALDQWHRLRPAFAGKLKSKHAHVTVFRPPFAQLARASLRAKFHR